MIYYLTQNQGRIIGPISKLLGFIMHGIYDFIATWENGIGLMFLIFVIIMFIWAARLLKTMSRDDKYIGYQGQRDDYTDTNYRQF